MFDEETEVEVRCNDCYWIGNESELIIDQKKIQSGAQIVELVAILWTWSLNDLKRTNSS